MIGLRPVDVGNFYKMDCGSQGNHHDDRYNDPGDESSLGIPLFAG